MDNIYVVKQKCYENKYYNFRTNEYELIGLENTIRGMLQFTPFKEVADQVAKESNGEVVTIDIKEFSG